MMVYLKNYIMAGYLPVLSIFLEVLSLPKKHFKDLLKVGWPLLVTGVGVTVGGSSFYESEVAMYSLLGLFLSIAYVVSIVVAIVGVHRVFLKEPDAAEESWLFNWTGNEVSYIACWVIIVLCSAGVMTALELGINFFISPPLDDASEEVGVYKLLNWLIVIPTIYFASRWSLALPASAIGYEKRGLYWSWKITRGNGLRLMVLIGFPYLISTIISDLIPSYESVLYSLTLDAFWLVTGVIQVGVLSLSYAYLVQFEDNQANAETANV